MAGKAIQDYAVVLNELNKQKNFDPLRDDPQLAETHIARHWLLVSAVDG